jgi:hypothetical protein
MIHIDDVNELCQYNTFILNSIEKLSNVTFLVSGTTSSYMISNIVPTHPETSSIYMSFLERKDVHTMIAQFAKNWKQYPGLLLCVESIQVRKPG